MMRCGVGLFDHFGHRITGRRDHGFTAGADRQAPAFRHRHPHRHLVHDRSRGRAAARRSRRGHSRSVRDAGDGSRVPPGAGSRPALVHALRHLARELHDRRHGHLARQQARDIGAHRHPARQHPLSRAERRGDCDAARGLSRHDGRPVPRDPVRQDDLDDDALHHFLSGVLRRLHPDRSPLGTVERIPEHLQHLPRHGARRQAPCGGAAGTHSHPGGGGAHDAHDPRRHHQSDDEPLHRDGGPQGHQAQTHHRASRFPPTRCHRSST